METSMVEGLIIKGLWADKSYLPSNIQFEQSEKNNNPEPRRFWEIDEFFKCPVIGACLDTTTQKRLLKKERISLKKKSAFEIHEILVGSSRNENSLSRRIDSLLNRKFKGEITEFFRLEEGDFIQLWKSRFKDGEIEGILWVAATHPDLSIKSRRSVFGDIHMEMHLNARQNRKVRQQLSYQEEENRKLGQGLKEAVETRRILNKEKESLEKEMDEWRQKYAFLEKEKRGLEKDLSELKGRSGILELQAENRELQDKMRKASDKASSYKQRINDLKDQNKRLLCDIESQREMNGLLKGEIETNITRISALNQCDETCPSFDLCRKRILIVGGITRMESLYRQLIEENGGLFEYHDGDMKGGARALENRVKRADMVLCPVNINSHNACSVVKKMGKKYGRPFQMLAGSGLGAISKALSEYQEGVSIQ